MQNELSLQQFAQELYKRSLPFAYSPEKECLFSTVTTTNKNKVLGLCTLYDITFSILSVRNKKDIEQIFFFDLHNEAKSFYDSILIQLPDINLSILQFAPFNVEYYTSVTKPPIKLQELQKDIDNVRLIVDEAKKYKLNLSAIFTGSKWALNEDYFKG